MKAFAVFALLAVAGADLAPRYGYVQPGYGYAPSVAYAEPSYAPVRVAYAEPSYDEAPVYAFNYAVADDYSGANFQAGENRDGYATSGSYSVVLPDGRTQTVTYKVADAYSGYVADVSYSGEAKYAPVAYKAAPAYHAAPAYQAAPAYEVEQVYEPLPVYQSEA